MNNNEPITQGLRKTVDSVFSFCGMDEVTHKALLDHCDNIDAQHESLENECTELREFHNRAKVKAKNGQDITLFGEDYTALPHDDDGMIVHLGDDMESITNPSIHGKVHTMELSNGGWRIFFKDVTAFATMCRHHEPTVADVLQEMMHEHWWRDNDEEDAKIIKRYAKRLRLADDAENRE